MISETERNKAIVSALSFRVMQSQQWATCDLYQMPICYVLRVKTEV